MADADSPRSRQIYEARRSSGCDPSGLLNCVVVSAPRAPSDRQSSSIQFDVAQVNEGYLRRTSRMPPSMATLAAIFKDSLCSADLFELPLARFRYGWIFVRRCVIAPRWLDLRP